MSWQAAHDQVINFVCKVSPTGKMCRNYLMSKYPECFRSNKGYVKLIMELPQKMWKRLFPVFPMPATDPSVCPICQDEEHEMTILTNGFKILFLLAASVAILYAILKVTAHRRPSVQWSAIPDFKPSQHYFRTAVNERVPHLHNTLQSYLSTPRDSSFTHKFLAHIILNTCLEEHTYV